MRYRPLSPTGDFTIGQPFLVNSPQAVGQAVLTRLKLWLGEWFLNTADGTPYYTQVLGERYGKSPDAAIKARILGTPGVTSLVAYSSTFVGGSARMLTVQTVVQTQYSVTPIPINIALVVPVG
jgi:hypothetical protein